MGWWWRGVKGLGQGKEVRIRTSPTDQMEHVLHNTYALVVILKVVSFYFRAFIKSVKQNFLRPKMKNYQNPCRNTKQMCPKLNNFVNLLKLKIISLKLAEMLAKFKILISCFAKFQKLCPNFGFVVREI